MVKSMSYTFFASDRIGNDDPSKTQDEIQSANYLGLASGNPFATDYSNEQSQINFALAHPGMVPVGVRGAGVGSEHIQDESSLLVDSTQGRNLSRLSLMQRQFATVPFLGRGSVDPVLESQILQGDSMKDKKSATPSLDTFSKYELHPESQEFTNEMQKKPIQETALKAPRGGASTRDVNVDHYQKRGTNGSL
jgi:hypothetical protein